MAEKGLLVVISAPSGGGKGTILKELFAQNENLRLSVSATTRAPRPGEEHGKQYYFLSREEFEALIAQGRLLEHAEYVGTIMVRPETLWRNGFLRAEMWFWRSRCRAVRRSKS